MGEESKKAKVELSYEDIQKNIEQLRWVDIT